MPENVNAVAVGQGNTAKNAVGRHQGRHQHQGQYQYQGQREECERPVAVGKGNTATNDVGVIGGK